MNNKLFDQIKKHEGCRLRAYKDSLGILTIGYGRNLEVLKISQEQAEKWLTEDIESAVNDLMEYVPIVKTLSITRQNVLINMTFNLGISGLLKFKKMWLAIESGDFNLASMEMLDSRWSTQVGYRSIELSVQMREG